MVFEKNSHISESSGALGCPNKRCGIMLDGIRLVKGRHMSEALSLFYTCRQTSKEAPVIYYGATTWGLPCRKLTHTSDMVRTERSALFRFLCEGTVAGVPVGLNVRHFKMNIFLSPVGAVSTRWPCHIDGSDPETFNSWYDTRERTAADSEVFTEEAQCEAYRNSLERLADVQANNFPNIRSINLVISLHWGRFSKERGVQRCGLAFEIRFNISKQMEGALLGEKKRMATEASKSHILACAEKLEPRRRMITPLGDLQTIYRVEVERHWEVRHCKRTPGRGTIMSLHPMRQYFDFKSMDELIAEAGPYFQNFQRSGLHILGISNSDVVEIVENTRPVPDATLLSTK